MTALDFEVTPANVPDCKLFIPLLSRVLSSTISTLIEKAYADNAYDTKKNKEYCVNNNIEPLFHTKEETGKNPKKKRSAKKKSKIRSKIETIFGISHENMGFGSVRVRCTRRVSIEISLNFIGWNLGILYASYIDQFKDRISLKRLLYRI